MNESIEIEISNWDKYNPRRDQKTYTWLRLDNSSWCSQELFGLTPTEKFVWIVLLSLAAKNNSAIATVDIDFVSHNLGIKSDAVSQAIEKICARHLATMRDHARTHTTPTYERTNVRTNDIAQNPKSIKQPAAPPDGFAEFYSRYPRKVGKTAAMKAWRRVASAPGFCLAELLAAREKYRAYLARSGTSAEYIKHPATFLGGWRDWLDPDVGQTESFASKPTLVRGPNYSDLARDLWASREGRAPVPESLQEFVASVDLSGAHRDDFRPNGSVPGMIKKFLEKTGAA